MKTWIQDNKAIVRCFYEEKEFVKAIGDYRFNKETKTWEFPLRKLIDIIDKLKIDYDENTRRIYENLQKEKELFHSKLNIGEKIKSGIVIGKQWEQDFCIKNLISVDLSDAMFHQLQGFYLSILFNSYALFYEAGTGKSYVAIKLIQHWKTPALIIAPLSTLENVWQKEIERWSKLKVVNLWQNLEEFKPGYDVYLINYEHFKKLHNQDKKLIPQLVDTIIIDESSSIKSNKSEITKTCLFYRDKIKHKLCLSGTPAPNNLLEYWTQMAFINDELLSDNFYKFRNTYFYSTGYGNFLYLPSKGAKEAIIANVGKQAFSVRKIDCLDLPDRIFEERVVYMEDIQQKAYDEMLHQNIIEFEGYTTIGSNQLAKIMKLRQVTSGFSITINGYPVLISKSKTLALKELIEEIPENQQIIIWCQFHWEIEFLIKELENCTAYYGQMNDKEKQKSLDSWLNKEKRILIGHPASGGMGLNLQQCSYMIWFSLSYSQEEFSQACDRIYRQGQRNKCTYFVLLAKRKEQKFKKDRLIDEVIYEVLQKKSDLMLSCMEILKK